MATALSRGDSVATARAFASATTQDYATAQASAVAKDYASGEALQSSSGESERPCTLILQDLCFDDVPLNTLRLCIVNTNSKEGLLVPSKSFLQSVERGSRSETLHY